MKGSAELKADHTSSNFLKTSSSNFARFILEYFGAKFGVLCFLVTPVLRFAVLPFTDDMSY